MRECGDNEPRMSRKCEDAVAALFVETIADMSMKHIDISAQRKGMESNHETQINFVGLVQTGIESDCWFKGLIHRLAAKQRL